MASLLRRLRSSGFTLLRSAVAAFVALTLFRHVAERVRGRRWGGLRGGKPSSEILPSLYDRHPRATAASRRRLGLRTVPVEEIVGTVRHPSQNTADFLPLPMLRGKNWQARWDRIVRAMNALRVLPPVDLYRVGDEYYVVDGHNRVAAALRMGQVAVDADVTELLIAGVEAEPTATRTASALIGADELWQAGSGRHSSTVEQRTAADQLSRRELLRAAGDDLSPAHRRPATPQPSRPDGESPPAGAEAEERRE